MAMVPAEKADLLDGIELPEADLYDLFYQVQKGLVEHRRADAAAAYERMVELDRQQRETARAALAARDLVADPFPAQTFGEKADKPVDPESCRAEELKRLE